MWLFVVAAGSGYLARCLQNASSKKPRLSEPLSENQVNQDPVVVKHDGQRPSRSPPQEVAADNFLISEEALRFKERFEKLGLQNEKFDETDSKKRYSDVLDDNNVAFSYQKGSCSAPSPGKSRGKTKGWSSSWPKLLKDSPASRKKVSGGISPDKATVPFEPDVNEFLNHQVSSEREVHVDPVYASSPDKESIVMETPVSLRQEAVSQGSLGSLFDWAAMASSQEPLVFGELSNQTTSSKRASTNTRRFRGRNKSSDSSTSGTPATRGQSSNNGPVLAPVEVLGKRKSVETPASQVSPREMLLFAAGLHTGVSCVLMYQKSKQQKLDDSNNSEAYPSTSGHCCRKVDDDNESLASIVTVEHAEPDQMAVLEAELEAELELMEFNMRTRKISFDRAGSSSGYASPNELLVDDLEENVSNPNVENWTLSPRDLDRRLHLVLEERQAERIKELEAELEEAEKELNKKDEELLSWKLRVNRLKALSLASSTDDAADLVTSERPSSRKRWFSGTSDTKPPKNEHPYEVFIPDTPTRYEDKGTAAAANGAVSYLKSSSRIPNSDNGSLEDLEEHMGNLTLSRTDNARHSFRDFLENARQANFSPSSDDDSRSSFPPTMGRRFSAGTSYPTRAETVSTSSKVEVTRNYSRDETIATKERLIYVNTTSQAENYSQQSHVIRTVQTNCRIEERRVGDKSGNRMSSRRHSAGSAFRSMNPQRQRRRWFS